MLPRLVTVFLTSLFRFLFALAPSLCVAMGNHIASLRRCLSLDSNECTATSGSCSIDSPNCSGRPHAGALLWSPRGRTSKERALWLDRAASAGSAPFEEDVSAVPSLLELSAQEAARAFDKIPPEQLAALPGDLMQQVVDVLVSNGDLTLMHLRRLGSPPDLDTVVLDGACRTEPVSDALVVELSRCPRLRDLDLSRCTGVTDRGIRALGASLPTLVHLKLNYCLQISDAALHHISGLTRLQTLELGGCEHLTDASLPHLSTLSLLTSLVLNQCARVHGGLDTVAGLARLTRLDLGWCTALGDEELGCLSRLTALRHLDLSATRVSDRGIAALSALVSLKQLSLKGCSLTGAAGATIGSSFAGLTRLDMDRCKEFGDEGCASLAPLRYLARLGLGHTTVTDNGLHNLSALGALTYLDLEACHITDAGGKALAHLPLLLHLNLADTAVQDPTLELLSTLHTLPAVAAANGLNGTSSLGRAYSSGSAPTPCTLAPKPQPRLRWLNLSYTPVSGAGMAHIKGLASLTHLNVDSASLNDTAMQHLSGLSRLTALEAFSVRLHETGAAAIAKLTGLKRLELCGGSLTDGACLHLSRLSLLTCLSLAHNPRITDAGAALLAGGLKALEELNLSGTGVSARCVHDLCSLRSLRLLSLCSTRLPDGALSGLKEGLPPGCLTKHSYRAA